MKKKVKKVVPVKVTVEAGKKQQDECDTCCAAFFVGIGLLGLLAVAVLSWVYFFRFPDVGECRIKETHNEVTISRVTYYDTEDATVDYDYVTINSFDKSSNNRYVTNYKELYPKVVDCVNYALAVQMGSNYKDLYNQIRYERTKK